MIHIHTGKVSASCPEMLWQYGVCVSDFEAFLELASWQEKVRLASRSWREPCTDLLLILPNVGFMTLEKGHTKGGLFDVRL